MLSQRTNILLHPEDHAMLTALAREQKTTIGHLIRTAIHKTYRDSRRKPSTKALMTKLQKLSKNMGISASEFYALRHEGHKY